MKSVQFLSIFFFLGAFALADEDKIETEDGVLVLTEGNFLTAFKKHDYILVEFYAPWCGHCKALAPEYAAAAKILEEQKSNIKLAKVDATENQDLAKKYAVRGYPTLKFFKRAYQIDYTGGRKAQEIVDWVVKKSGPLFKQLESVDEAKAFIENSQIAVIGFFTNLDGRFHGAFNHIIEDVDEVEFGMTSNPDVLAEYKITEDTILMFKKFDEEIVKYEGDDIYTNIKRFIAINALPFLVEFNQETAQKIFGGEIKNHLLLFLKKDDEDYQRITEAAKSIAKPFRDNVLFVTVDATEEDHQRILEFFGMKSEEVPAARLIHLADEMAKYKPPTNELTAESLKNFVQDFLDGKLKQHLLSQPLPEDWDKDDVKVLVSENFDSVTLDKDKDVLVEFYAPWCGHCKQLLPIYERLAKHYKDNPNVVIAKIDSTANELEDHKILSFPTIKLFKKETNEIVSYVGARTFEALLKFVDTGKEEDVHGEAPEYTPEEEDIVRDEL
ncbi:protein disulfide-isomerase [Dendroctonus ponderosae]